MGLELVYNVDGKETTTVESFLLAQHFSKKSLVALKHKDGKVLINDKISKLWEKASPGDVVIVAFGEEELNHKLPPHQGLVRILYEDDYLLVVDKPAGLAVMPAGIHSTSLANIIAYYYESIKLKSTIHFVNRLDRGTSGVVIVAKYRHIHHLMMRQMNSIKRKYYALVEGMLNTEAGIIDASIYRPTRESILRVVDSLGQRAVTEYKIVKKYPNKTLVECSLKTGRTHQIRVHMQHLGHSVVDDPLYGDTNEGDHQMLHSYFVNFLHPITGEEIEIKTAIPERFMKNLKRCD